jgi:hypothetical protein
MRHPQIPDLPPAKNVWRYRCHKRRALFRRTITRESESASRTVARPILLRKFQPLLFLTRLKHPVNQVRLPNDKSNLCIPAFYPQVVELSVDFDDSPIQVFKL